MSLIDIFFPRFCFGCGFVGSYLCLSCVSVLILSDEVCFYCQKKSYFGLTHPKCQKKWGIDGFICIYKYNDVFKKVVKKIKYKLIKDSMREIIPILLEPAVQSLCFYKRLHADICLQPVPLYSEKEKQRGFNQSYVISQYVSQLFDIKTVDLAKRILNTKSQTELSLPRERLNNVRGAFKFDQKTTHIPKVVLIVDDVVTTGSTVKELACVLKKNEVGHVFVFSLAKG